MRLLILFLIAYSTTLRAEPLRVITTIAPLYGIVADLMQGVATPVTIITKGADPHYFALKPSQISALNDADIIFAVGADMEPWLERMLPSLTAEIAFLAELSTQEHRLSRRALDEIGSAQAPREFENFDPHMWLDTDQGGIWTFTIAEILSRNDPENTTQYIANAIESLGRIAVAKNAVAETVTRLGELKIVVSHDSLQYFANQFGLNIVGALSNISDEKAGPRILSQLSRLEEPVCLLIDASEPSLSFDTLFPDWRQVVFDPMGYDFAGKPNYLANLYLSLAAALESCITEP